uniref:TELO2-interacting protein 1 homolog n=1 Tax=Saccoglossus kowalevskii TaxID=10224 RepID=A0ABM0MIB8_SACKO|nr:PREDICTED: TELO2-interacting protein 1 homolog [Saccoglossus kowalevskii]
MTAQSAFERLKPLCIAITKGQTKENMRRLNSELDSINNDDLQRLQEYLLFPLRIVIKMAPTASQDTSEEALRCMTKVINKTTITNKELFTDLFTQLVIIISSPVNYGQVNQTSEELKLSVVFCLRALIKQANESVMDVVYADNFMPALGHCISILLSIAEHEQLKELRIESMLCLLDLIQYKDTNLDGFGSHPLISGTFSSFLPGITMAICRIITGYPKQGQSVIINAINVWSKFVAMVMNDAVLQNLLSSNQLFPDEKRQTDEGGKSEDTNSDGASERGKKLRIVRNEEWVKNTSKKLNILINKIVILRTHISWKVRIAMVEFAERLLLNCTRSLSDSVSSQLEILVGLVGDDYAQVSTASQQALDRYSRSHLQTNSKTLVEILEENLHTLMTSLPRLIRTADDSQKLSTLNLVLGYLKLLGLLTMTIVLFVGDKVNSLLYSASHLRRLSTALIQVLELDTSDIKIVEEKTPFSDLPVHTGMSDSSLDVVDRTVSHHYPGRRTKYFKHFRDERIFEILMQICRLLGFHGNIQLLTDHFVDKFRESNTVRKQVTLIINEILLGTIGDDVTASCDDVTTSCDDVTDSCDDVTASCDDVTTPSRDSRDKRNLESIVRSLLEEYISPSNWRLVTSSQSEVASSRKSVSDRLLVLSQKTNQLSLGTLNSNILQICLLLEGVGVFAKVLGSNFNVLLIDSLYPVMEKLGDETAVISQTAYLCLIAICKSCAYSSIEDLICKNCDYLIDVISHNLRHLDWFPKSPDVLKVMLQYGNADVLPLTQDIIDELKENVEDKKESFTSVASFFLEYQKQKKTARGEVSDEEDNDDGSHDNNDGGCPEKDETVDEDDFSKPDVKPEQPLHIRVVLQVLQKCVHFLSDNNPRIRLLVLEIVKNSVLALQNHQDDLLPLVHQIWPPMIQRFVDNEQLVTIQAFHTLCVMGSICGDFIRRRVVKDIWPKLIAFLNSQSAISLKSGPAYKHTVGYKKQLAFLNGIGKLSEMAASCTFQSFINIEPDMTWLVLNDIYTPINTLKPPCQGFSEIKFAGSNSQDSEFAENVGILLKKL